MPHARRRSRLQQQHTWACEDAYLRLPSTVHCADTLLLFQIHVHIALIYVHLHWKIPPSVLQGCPL